MIGEQNVDDTVWIIKSHKPMRIATINYFTNKIVVCVRNPFDTIMSTVHYYNTFSQSAQLENDVEVDEPEYFARWLNYILIELVRFQNELLAELREKNLPMYFLKFEELRDNPRPLLLEVFSFLFGVTDVRGTGVEKRIDEVIAMGHDATKLYKTKKSDKKFN